MDRTEVVGKIRSLGAILKKSNASGIFPLPIVLISISFLLLKKKSRIRFEEWVKEE